MKTKITNPRELSILKVFCLFVTLTLVCNELLGLINKCLSLEGNKSKASILRARLGQLELDEVKRIFTQTPMGTSF
jgi:hypothetical protein